jgi:hypothetical protein
MIASAGEPRRSADAAVVARAALWMLASRAAKFLVPLPRLARLMTAPPRTTRRDRRRERRVTQLVDRVAHALRLPHQGNCLERSLVLYRMLSRAGAAPQLIVGMSRRAPGRIAGHAWVTVDGEPVGELVPEDMAPVATFQSRSL